MAIGRGRQQSIDIMMIHDSEPYCGSDINADTIVAITYECQESIDVTYVSC